MPDDIPIEIILAWIICIAVVVTIIAPVIKEWFTDDDYIHPKNDYIIDNLNIKSKDK